jgi:hypothetical protein
MAKASKYRQFKRRIHALKVERGCARCGYNRDPRALQFHHRDGRNGSPHIMTMNTWSWDKVAAEIDKCDILCANCHAIETHPED